jgi:hypothetical protein
MCDGNPIYATAIGMSIGVVLMLATIGAVLVAREVVRWWRCGRLLRNLRGIGGPF